MADVATHGTFKFDHQVGCDRRKVKIKRVVPNLTTARLDASREFYTDLLGFEVVMDMDWIVTLASPDNPTAQISLVRGEGSDAANENVTITVEVGDIEAIHAGVVSRGYPIAYALTDEPWGVHRFQLKDPNGVLINVMSHLE